MTEVNDDIFVTRSSDPYAPFADHMNVVGQQVKRAHIIMDADVCARPAIPYIAGAGKDPGVGRST